MNTENKEKNYKLGKFPNFNDTISASVPSGRDAQSNNGDGFTSNKKRNQSIGEETALK